MSKGENMVERCARAIFDTWSEHQDGYAVHQMTWADAVQAASDPEKYPKMAKIVPMARAEARAVIEALTEPTPEMLASGAGELRRFDRDREFSDVGASAVFLAMLRTALSQPNDEGDGK